MSSRRIADAAAAGDSARNHWADGCAVRADAYACAKTGLGAGGEQEGEDQQAHVCFRGCWPEGALGQQGFPAGDLLGDAGGRGSAVGHPAADGVFDA